MRSLGLRPFLRANILDEPDIIGENRHELEALERNAQDLFRDDVSHSPQLSDDLQNVAMRHDILRASPTSSPNVAQPLDASAPRSCWTSNVRKRLEILIRELSKELEVLELRSKINEQVQEQVSQNQREYLLREQMKAIREEFGEVDDAQAGNRRIAHESRTSRNARGSRRRNATAS